MLGTQAGLDTRGCRGIEPRPAHLARVSDPVDRHAVEPGIEQLRIAAVKCQLLGLVVSIARRLERSEGRSRMTSSRLQLTQPLRTQDRQPPMVG